MVSSCCCSCWAIMPNAKPPVSSGPPPNVAAPAGRAPGRGPRGRSARASAGRQQRQRGPLGPRVLERVVERVDLRVHRLPAAHLAQQPELFLVGDVRQVPDQRGHQRGVLADQVGVVHGVGEQPGALPGREQVPGDQLPQRLHSAAGQRARCGVAGVDVMGTPPDRRRGGGISGDGHTGSGRGAGLVEPVVGGAPAAEHVTRRRTRRPRRGSRRARRAGRAPRRPRRSIPGWPRPARVVPGRAGPRAAAGSPGRQSFCSGSHRGHRGLGGDRVVEQGGHHRGRHDPAVARLGVDDPELQVPARPDRREQGGQVIVQVVGGGRAARTAPRSQSRNVRPEGADQRRDPGSRTHHDLGVEHVAHPRGPGIGVFRPGRPRSAAPGSTSSGARVRLGSSRDHTACRVDFQPDIRPSWNGEFANEATSTGPSPCRRCQRHRKPEGPPCSCPASTHTWTEAVLHIMTRPHGPLRSKNSSIAA